MADPTEAELQERLLNAAEQLIGTRVDDAHDKIRDMANIYPTLLNTISGMKDIIVKHDAIIESMRKQNEELNATVKELVAMIAPRVLVSASVQATTVAGPSTQPGDDTSDTSSPSPDLAGRSRTPLFIPDPTLLADDNAMEVDEPTGGLLEETSSSESSSESESSSSSSAGPTA